MWTCNAEASCFTARKLFISGLRHLRLALRAKPRRSPACALCVGYPGRSILVGIPAMAHPTLMLASETALLVVDVQEKLMAKIPRAAEIIRNIAFLSDAAKALGMPTQATEQYPKGLGGSVADIVQRYPDRPDKLGFSCCAIPKVVEVFRTAACVARCWFFWSVSSPARSAPLSDHKSHQSN